VLAVIHEEEELPSTQVSDQDLHRLRPRLIPEIKGCEHGVRHEGCFADLAKLDQPGSVREATREIGSDANGEPRLAHATRADQADQASGRELLSDLTQLASAADKCRCLRRQVA
jgi:hypothetical protein